MPSMPSKKRLASHQPRRGGSGGIDPSGVQSVGGGVVTGLNAANMIPGAPAVVVGQRERHRAQATAAPPAGGATGTTPSSHSHQRAPLREASLQTTTPASGAE